MLKSGSLFTITHIMSLSIINFTNVVVLGGVATDDYYGYWGSLPYPRGGVNVYITAEVAGLGDPTFQGHGAVYPQGGYSFLYNRPVVGNYKVDIKVKTPANETIPINFNCVVEAAILQITAR